MSALGPRRDQPEQTCEGRRLGRGTRVFVSLAIALLALPICEARADEGQATRWPRWPGEVQRIVAPLYDSNATEGAQLRALGELGPFRTAIIEVHVLAALGRSSPSLQSRALTMCFSREIRRCADPAVANMRGDPALAALAASVVALDPSGARLDALFEGMALGTDSVRVACTKALGGAALSDLNRERVRERLIAKLNDISAEVRAAAATSLGLLRARAASPALARALEDPDPSVVEAAARGLADLQDDRALPALVRIAERSIDPNLVKLALRSIARLPGAEADAQLLGWLEARPPRIALEQLVAAIGLRNPSEALVAELVIRLRIPSLRGPAESILHLMGPDAAPFVRAQWREDDDRSTQSTLIDLLASWTTPASAPTATIHDSARPAAPQPRSRAVSGAIEMREDARAARDQIAIARMSRDPAAATQLAQRWIVPRERDQASTESALVALAARRDLPGALGTRSEQRWRVAALRATALNQTFPIETRCLALRSLAFESDRRAVDTLDEFSSADTASLRACSITARLNRALGLAGDRRQRQRTAESLIASALVDPSERVRLSLCVALIELLLGEAPSRRLRHLAEAVVQIAAQDSRDSVRQASAIIATLTLRGHDGDGLRAGSGENAEVRRPLASRTIRDPMPGSNLVSRPGFMLAEAPGGATLEIPVWGARRWTLTTLPPTWRPVYRSLPPVQGSLGPWNFD